MRNFALFFLIFSLLQAGSVWAQDGGTPTVEQDGGTSDVILDRIKDAKRALTGVNIGIQRIGGENAVLAVWNPKDQKKISLVTVRGGISRTKGFAVTLERKNGVNSRYRVTKPEGCLVLALKTNIKNRTGSKGRAQSAIYAPYSPDLKRPELVEAGRQYLIALVDRAAESLDGRDVRSIHDPEALVTETIPERALITLLVIEHMTPSEFDSIGTKETVEQVLVTVALNGEDSYDYAFSSAMAGGLAQFIRETYKLTRQRYPKAKMNKDFIVGMRDHENAAMAQYCLADWSLGRLPEDVRARLADGTHEEELGAYLAAAYNGGEERASRVYGEDPVNWEKDVKCLPKQTLTYVREFHAVYRYLFSTEPQTQTPGQ